MSEENIEAFKRAIDVGTRRDYEAPLNELDPDVEWHPGLLASLEGKPTVYRGSDGVREWFRDADEVLGESHMEFSEIRDLGGRIVAFGQYRTRGEASGAEIGCQIAYVVDYRNGKATRVQSFLDPEDALEAAGLSE
jgi:ketosteroid isomerase-like protein